MSFKDAIIIAVISFSLVGGAITGIVGGAAGIVIAATALHNLVDGPH